MTLYCQAQIDRLAVDSMAAMIRGRGPIGLPFEFFVRKILPHDWGQQEVVINALAG